MHSLLNIFSKPAIAQIGNTLLVGSMVASMPISQYVIDQGVQPSHRPKRPYFLWSLGAVSLSGSLTLSGLVGQIHPIAGAATAFVAGSAALGSAGALTYTLVTDADSKHTKKAAYAALIGSGIGIAAFGAHATVWMTRAGYEATTYYVRNGFDMIRYLVDVGLEHTLGWKGSPMGAVTGAITGPLMTVGLTGAWLYFGVAAHETLLSSRD